MFFIKKEFILNKFSNYHLFRQAFMVGVWTVVEQKETMKYITFKCYLRLTPFLCICVSLIPQLWFLYVAFERRTSAKQAKNNGTPFLKLITDDGTSERKAKLRKAAYVFADYDERTRVADMLCMCANTHTRYCIDTVHALPDATA